jgi:hypothetical protein
MAQRHPSSNAAALPYDSEGSGWSFVRVLNPGARESAGRQQPVSTMQQGALAPSQCGDLDCLDECRTRLASGHPADFTYLTETRSGQVPNLQDYQQDPGVSNLYAPHYAHPRDFQLYIASQAEKSQRLVPTGFQYSQPQYVPCQNQGLYTVSEDTVFPLRNNAPYPDSSFMGHSEWATRQPGMAVPLAGYAGSQRSEPQLHPAASSLSLPCHILEPQSSSRMRLSHAPLVGMLPQLSGAGVSDLRSCASILLSAFFLFSGFSCVQLHGAGLVQHAVFSRWAAGSLCRVVMDLNLGWFIKGVCTVAVVEMLECSSLHRCHAMVWKYSALFCSVGCSETPSKV